MYKWTEIESKRWSADQRKIIDDFAELEVRTLDLLQGIYRTGALIGRPRHELESLIKEYQEKLYN